MIRNISIGIDIGTITTKVVVGEFIKGEKNPKIIGVGESPTLGLRHGYVVSVSEAGKSLKKAKAIAELASGVKIKRAFVSINSITTKGETSTGSAIISKADSEVTNLDINKALEDAENNLNLGNKKVIHTIPISYRLDGKEVLGRLEGMRGNKLEVKALFVSCSHQHWEDLLETVAEAGIETIDFVAGAVSASYIALTKRHQIVGSALVDIGGETTSLAVFDNEALVYLQTFSIGGNDITNDIALGLKTTLEEAEGIKLGNITDKYPKKKIDEIIDARLSDIFELVENHLKKIKRNELLPAGIVFTGGGANIANIEELSKTFLKLPSRVGTTEMFGNMKTKLRDPMWFSALGLLLAKDSVGYSEGSFSNLFKDIKNAIKSSIKQLMP